MAPATLKMLGLAGLAAFGHVATASSSSTALMCGALGGVSFEKVCCEAMCGECGGAGCSQRPGGKDACCVQEIIETGTMCDDSGMAPCLIDEEYLEMEGTMPPVAAPHMMQETTAPTCVCVDSGDEPDSEGSDSLAEATEAPIEDGDGAGDEMDDAGDDMGDQTGEETSDGPESGSRSIMFTGAPTPSPLAVDPTAYPIEIMETIEFDSMAPTAAPTMAMDSYGDRGIDFGSMAPTMSPTAAPTMAATSLRDVDATGGASTMRATVALCVAAVAITASMLA